MDPPRLTTKTVAQHEGVGLKTPNFRMRTLGLPAVRHNSASTVRPVRQKRTMMSPSLADLDAFVAVARARGFRGAAAARGASASGLSEAVRRLEAALGVRLLNRTTRSVTPTDGGDKAARAARAGPAPDRERARRGERLPREPTQDARLNVPAIVAMKILPSIVSRFPSRPIRA